MVMEVNEQGILKDIDTEFLHDYRIALRRTRALVAVMKPSLPQDFATLKKELGWLGQITGLARDLDVYLLEFSSLSSAVPEKDRVGLAPLHKLLLKKRMVAYRALGRALTSERYRRIKQRWRGVLRSFQADDETSPPIWREAGRRIRRLYGEALHEGTAISAQSPPEQLHELRKTCKKLRYLIEFFGPLYSETRLRNGVRALKKLQNNLGLYQDAQIQRALLMSLLGELEVTGTVALDTRRAMEHLAAQRATMQDQARRQFDEIFLAFASDEAEGGYRKLFKAASSGRDHGFSPEGRKE
nr:CHAD domain-containing protein [Govania unica]